jgi:flavorubredoxin
MATVTEIAPDLYRVSIYAPRADLQFNHFLVLDEEPLLFHTGFRAMFPEVSEAVATLLDPAQLRWVAFSHFEADECGSLNEWLGVAPHATALCGKLGALLSVNDFAVRRPRGLVDQEVLATGRFRFRFLQTPHVPHSWDAGLLFEETNSTLLCSDLLHHQGDVDPSTSDDVVERARLAHVKYEAAGFANYMPYTPATDRIMDALASLRPRTLAIMHGSAFKGDCAGALRAWAGMMRR